MKTFDDKVVGIANDFLMVYSSHKFVFTLKWGLWGNDGLLLFG